MKDYEKCAHEMALLVLSKVYDHCLLDAQAEMADGNMDAEIKFDFIKEYDDIYNKVVCYYKKKFDA